LPRGDAIGKAVRNAIETGATAMEYGLMTAAIAGVLIIVAYCLGGKISNALSNVAEHL